MEKIEENDSMFKKCKRFQRPVKPFYNFEQDKAIIYLKLREEGCDKKKAAVFSQKELCRADTTLEHDGPSSCRILKPVFDQKYQINSGWQTGIHFKYEMGDRFFSSVKDVIGDTDVNNQLDERLTANENKVKDDFKMKIKQLTQFYEELNAKYNYSSYGKQALVTKLKQLESEMRKFKTYPRKYLKSGQLQFFELVEEYENARSQADTLLGQFNAFPSIFAEQEVQLKQKVPKLLFECRRKQAESFPLYNSKAAGKKVEDQAASRNAAINRLVQDGKYVIGISQNEDLVESTGGKKEKLDSEMANYLTTLSLKKALLAEEFNKSNYVLPGKTNQLNHAKNLELQKLKQVQPQTPRFSIPSSPTHSPTSSPLRASSPLRVSSPGSRSPRSSPFLRSGQSFSHLKVQKVDEENTFDDELSQSETLNSQQSGKSANNWEVFRKDINNFIDKQVDKLYLRKQTSANDLSRINTKNYDNQVSVFSAMKEKALSRCSSRHNSSSQVKPRSITERHFQMTPRVLSGQTSKLNRTPSTFCQSVTSRQLLSELLLADNSTINDKGRLSPNKGRSCMTTREPSSRNVKEKEGNQVISITNTQKKRLPLQVQTFSKIFLEKRGQLNRMAGNEQISSRDTKREIIN